MAGRSGSGRSRGRGCRHDRWLGVGVRQGGRAGRVVVLERGLAGRARRRAQPGIVRAQGGTPATVALGRWTIDFYNGQQAAYGTDLGFRELGYLILAVTEEDERAGRERVAMQRANGLDVAWLDAAEAAAAAVTLSPDGHRGGSYVATDGAIDPPRNVRAYSLAMQAAGVELRERTTFTGLRTAPSRGGGSRVARRRDGPRHDRDRPGPAHRRSEPASRRAGRRVAHPGRCCPPHGRRPRAASRPSTCHACRWSSTSVTGSTGGSRRAGCCLAGAIPTSNRARPAIDRLGGVRPRPSATGRVRADHARARPASDLGRHDRLHARSPADHRTRP